VADVCLLNSLSRVPQDPRGPFRAATRNVKVVFNRMLSGRQYGTEVNIEQAVEEKGEVGTVMLIVMSSELAWWLANWLTNINACGVTRCGCPITRNMIGWRFWLTRTDR
jgi:hypothetical protein